MKKIIVNGTNIEFDDNIVVELDGDKIKVYTKSTNITFPYFHYLPTAPPYKIGYDSNTDPYYSPLHKPYKIEHGSNADPYITTA